MYISDLENRSRVGSFEYNVLQVVIHLFKTSF